MGMMDPIKSNGLFMIDSADAIKALKLKDKSTTNAVKKLLSDYQSNYDALTIELSDQINSIEQTRNAMSKQREEGGGDREKMRSEMMKMRTITQEIRAKAIKIHKTLNEGLQSEITVDSYKKWIRFYNGVCADNYFSLERGDRPQRKSNGEGQGRGPRG